MARKGDSYDDAGRKARARRPGRTSIIPTLTPEVRQWREALEQSDADWLRWFFPDRPFGFWYDFTQQQEAMIAAIGEAIAHGGDQAIAASRGEGKTVIARRLAIKYVLSGRVSFVVLFAATAADAGDSLQSIRGEIEDNDRLWEYYPEVCQPVRDLEGVAQKASSMLASGERHDNGGEYVEEPIKFTWCGHEITMPNVPGSPSAGAIIATRGLDAAVRGLNKKGRRPDVAIIDDPDTEKTARSEDQAEKLEQRIDKAIAGLGGQQRGIARVMLTTLQNRNCVSYRYTDPAAKPTWKGKRFRFLLKPPDRADLWQEYVDRVVTDIQKRGEDGEPLDPFTRDAHRFYLSNREAMEAGAVVANPHRFDPADLGDGTLLEESALQRYYNMVARIGPDAVATEYDNDPPESGEAKDDGLTPHRIQHQVSGYPRRVVPPDCNRLTMGVDVGKFLLHWVVVAWRPDGTSYLIDYGTQDVRGTTRGTEEGMEQAITSAIRALCSQKTDEPYARADGELVPLDMTLVDSGWGLTTSAVYAATRDLGSDVAPAKGEGDGATGDNGRGGGVYRPAQNRTWDILPGDRWKRHTLRKDRVKLFLWDAGYWKDWGINRWLTPVDKPGCRFIWGTFAAPERQRVKDHAQVSYHLCANCYNDVPGRGRIWGERPGMDGDKDHWQDAQAMADVAASVVGVRLGVRLDDKQGDTAAEPKPRGKSKLGFKPLAEIR